ncbi:MAG: DUF5050 domain-containing protein [Clostridia bacterium]
MEDKQFNPNETMTRKEYLRSKKKQYRKSIRKSTIMFCVVISVLSIYVCTQLYVYSAGESTKYTEGEGIREDVYGAYYVVPSYTYNTNYSVSYVQTDGANEKVILENTAFSNIVVDDTHIYGVRQGVLYRLNKSTLSIEEIVNSQVEKFVKIKERIYFVTGTEKDGGKVESVNIDGTDRKVIYDKYAFQIIGDDSGIYVIANDASARNIVKLGFDGESKNILVKSSSSNLILYDEHVYYANKSDNSKIYKVSKNNPADNIKLSDNSAVADKGSVRFINGKKVFFIRENQLYYINASDGYKLYKIDLDGNNDVCVLDVKIDTICVKDSIVFFTSKNEMGFCSYNLKTGLMKQISNKRISEFTIVESETDKKEK